MSAFYINFGLPKIEEIAADLGFKGPRWRTDVLEDLLFDGQLRVWKGRDLTDSSRTIWYCMGRRASIACSLDSYVDDALFCIGIVKGPQAGGPSDRWDLFRVPGPWRVHAMGRRAPPPVPLGEHLERMHGMGWNEEAESTVAPRSSSPGKSGSSSGMGLSPEALKALASVKVAAVDPIPGPPAGKTDSREAGPNGPPPLPAPPDADPTVEPLNNSTESNQQATSVLSYPKEATADAGPEGTTPSDSEQRTAHAGRVQAPAFEQPEGGAYAPATQVPLPPPTVLCVEAAGSWPEAASSLLGMTYPAMAELLQSDDPQEARRRTINRLEADLVALTARLEAIPGAEEVAQAVDQKSALVALGLQLGSEPPPVLQATSIWQFERALQALGRGILEQLPAWALGSTGANPVNTILGASHQLDSFCALLDWLDATFAGAPPSALRTVVDPGGKGNSLDRLHRAWHEEAELASFRDSLTEDCLPIIRAVSASDRAPLARKLGGWGKALSPGARAGLLQELADAGVAAERTCPNLTLIADLDEDDRETLGDIGQWTRARRYLEKLGRSGSGSGGTEPRTRRPPPTPGEGPGLLRFEHTVTDERGSVIAAPLVVPEPSSDAPAVLLEVPIRLAASGPFNESIRLQISSPAISSVPRTIVLPAQAELVSRDHLRVLHWTVDATNIRWTEGNTGRWYLEEVVTVPVTLGFAKDLRSGKERLGLTLSGGKVSQTLQFERVVTEMPALVEDSGLGDATASDMIRNHALGAQVRHEKLEALVREGREPFMVVAPRRFGKTTLLLHLATRAEEASHHVVKVLLPRHLAPDQAAQQVWETIRESLEQQFDTTPRLRPLPNTLNDEGAWRSVRRFVKDRGRDALVLLIDEAQALVPRVGGEGWGNHFKTFVEGFLVQPEEGLARAEIGLFGTVDLSVRIGQNCRDFLLMHGTEQHAFDDESLGRFLRTVSQGHILSSRQARVTLVEWTNNLRTLNAVLDRVRARLRNKQRLFVVHPDALEVVREMLDPNNAEAQKVWEYARSELSHHDEWEPVDAFPLAVAWARPQVEKMSPMQRLNQCIEWLDGELNAVGATGRAVRSRVEEGLRDLKDRGVLRDDGTFWRPLLRELLSRNQDILRNDTASQHALLRIAVDSVQLPEQLQVHDEGAQAKVHMVTTGTSTQAYRVCALETEEERRRFARTCAAVRTLRDRRTRTDGDRHLPRVSLAGFRSDDPHQGVIVYDWIEGRPLSSMWDQIPLAARVQVVRQVTLAVQSLQARDIIHCDIAPRNILVDGGMNATLIDFGLARHVDSQTRTQLGSDVFKAPEQCQAEPWVERRTDVYALGRLLLGPRDGSDLDDRLRALATRMTSEQVDARPSILFVLEELAKVPDLDLQLHGNGVQLEDIINDAPEWLWDDLLQFKTQTSVMMASLMPWDAQRAMEVAHFLNCLFATVITRSRTADADRLRGLRPGEEPSLAATRGLIAERGLSHELGPWMGKEVLAVGLLRNAWSHPTDRKTLLDRARKELRTNPGSDLEEFRSAARRVAEQIDTILPLGQRVVTRFLTPFWAQPAGHVANAVR